jgi:hypothetical protein
MKNGLKELLIKWIMRNKINKTKELLKKWVAEAKNKIDNDSNNDVK